MRFSGHASPDAISSVAVAFVVLAGLTVALRLLTRIVFAHRAGLDDAFIAVAWILAVAMSVAMCEQAKWGMGQHLSTIDVREMQLTTIWFWASLWLYYSALGFIKLSILTQYLRVFVQDTFRRACFVMIGLVVVSSCWAIFSGIFMCNPVYLFWTAPSLYGDPKCFNRLRIWYINAGVNIITDFAVAILPLPVIHSLEVSKQQRLLLLLVFGIGGFTCMISIMRLAYIYPVSVSPDLTWESPLACIWSSVETNIAIMCACMPCLKGFVERAMPSMINSMRSYVKAYSSTSAHDSTLKNSGQEASYTSSSITAFGPTHSSSDERLFHHYRHAARDEPEFGCIGMDEKSINEKRIEVLTVINQISQTLKPSDESGGLRFPGSNMEKTWTTVSGVGQPMGLEALDEISHLPSNKVSPRSSVYFPG